VNDANRNSPPPAVRLALLAELERCESQMAAALAAEHAATHRAGTDAMTRLWDEEVGLATAPDALDAVIDAYGRGGL